MKRISYIMLTIGLGAALAFCGGQADSERSGVVKTIISNIEGAVSIERAGSAEEAAQGMLLEPADVIITGEGSSVDLAVQGYGVVKIGASSRVLVQTLTMSSEQSRAELRLDRGEMASFIDRSDANSDYAVVTPTAIAGVRGTAFLVSVDDSADEPEVKVAVMQGSVAVQMPGQEEVIVTENSQMVIQGQRRIANEMVRPLSDESLEEMKRLAVFHKSNVLEFNRMLDDIQSGTAALQVLEGDEVGVDSALDRRDEGATEVVDRASRADVTEHLARDTEGDPIQLSPDSDYSDQ